MQSKKSNMLVVLSVTTIFGFFSEARAGSTNLVANGGFELTTGGPGQLGKNTDALGWTSGTSLSPGYNFLFAAGTADQPGGSAGLELWGPGTGSNNGLTASSPDGGNFVALGGDPNLVLQPLTQTINTLVSGDTYTVSFYWAGAQQAGANGITTDQIQVGFGSDTQSTAVVTNASQGFTGWMAESFNFTANSTSEVLSFFAVSTPAGLPPFALLDGVSVTAAVPEPSSFVILALGLSSMGVVGVRRRMKANRA